MGLFLDITIFGDFGFLLYFGVHLGTYNDTFWAENTPVLPTCPKVLFVREGPRRIIITASQPPNELGGVKAFSGIPRPQGVLGDLLRADEYTSTPSRFTLDTLGTNSMNTIVFHEMIADGVYRCIPKNAKGIPGSPVRPAARRAAGRTKEYHSQPPNELGGSRRFWEFRELKDFEGPVENPRPS